MRTKLSALLAVLALVAAACGGGEGLAEKLIEESLENEGGGDVNVDIDDGDGSFSIEVEGEDGGSFQFGTGDIPDELTVAIASGGDVQTSIVSEGEVLVSLLYPVAEFDALVDFYEAWTADQPTDFAKTTSSFDSGGTTIRSATFYGDETNTTISVTDCPSAADGTDAVCVNIIESPS